MKLALLLIPLLLISSCSTKKEEAVTGALPETRPLDFVLETHYGGGMRDTSAGFFISADSSFFKIHTNDTTIVRAVTISPMELDTLYAILKNNEFDKIESSIDSTVLDAESYSIDVYWNKNQNSVSVTDGGRKSVKEVWRSQWKAINEYLNGFIAL